MFNLHISLSESEYEQCRNFAKKSSPTQRESRSGGTQIRDVGMIFYDTLRGKLGEFIIKKFLKELYGLSVELDMGVYPRGEWDDSDIKINNKHLSIKTAKWFSNWLMIEKKDIARGDLYDYYIFVTIDKSMHSGDIRGFATQKEILDDPDTNIVAKGELIPRTQTVLDADNYLRHASKLHNTENEWNNLINSMKES